MRTRPSRLAKPGQNRQQGLGRGESTSWRPEGRGKRVCAICPAVMADEPTFPTSRWRAPPREESEQSERRPARAAKQHRVVARTNTGDDVPRGFVLPRRTRSVNWKIAWTLSRSGSASEFPSSCCRVSAHGLSAIGYYLRCPSRAEMPSCLPRFRIACARRYNPGHLSAQCARSFSSIGRD
jgi:hypothetical protein